MNNEINHAHKSSTGELEQSIFAHIDFVIDLLNSVLDLVGQVLQTLLLQVSRQVDDLLLCRFAEPLLQLLIHPVVIHFHLFRIG